TPRRTSAEVGELDITPRGRGGGCSVPCPILVDELPHHAIFGEEATPRFRYASAAIARHRAVLRNHVEQRLPLSTLSRLRGNARGQADELFPRIFEAGLRALVSVDEFRIGVGVVREHGKRRFAVEPCCI